MDSCRVDVNGRPERSSRKNRWVTLGKKNHGQVPGFPPRHSNGAATAQMVDLCELTQEAAHQMFCRKHRRRSDLSHLQLPIRCRHVFKCKACHRNSVQAEMRPCACCERARLQI